MGGRVLAHPLCIDPCICSVQVLAGVGIHRGLSVAGFWWVGNQTHSSASMLFSIDAGKANLQGWESHVAVVVIMQ